MANASPQPRLSSMPDPENEVGRLAALQQYNILDTPPEIAFDRITDLAARLFGVPTVLIALVDHDRVWFKSCHGFDRPQIERAQSLCSYGVMGGTGLVVLDAQQDERFSSHPLVQQEGGIRFYAGVPLVNRQGFTLGTFCLIDTQPWAGFDPEQQASLANLADMVMDALELRLNVRRLADIDAALVNLSREMATETGEGFFQTLVHRFTQTLGVDYAYIGLLKGPLAEGGLSQGKVPHDEAAGAKDLEGAEDPVMIKTLVFCAQGTVVDNITYHLSDTPCYQVLQNRHLCCYASGVQALFPQASLLQDWGIEGYAAVPFFDQAGQPLGLLGIMHRQPLMAVHLVETLLPIFALRTATELERQRTDLARRQLQYDLEQLVAQRTAELSDANYRLRQESAERHQTAIALQKDQETLQVLLDSVQAGIVACNETGLLTLFNQAARKFHGLPARPLPPDQLSEYYDLYRADGKTPLPTEEIPLLRALRHDRVDNAEMVIAPQQGRVRTLLASGRAIADRDGNKLGAVVVMHDITDRKAMENALLDREAQLASIFQTIPDGVLIIDRQGRLVRVNAAAETILRLSASDLLKRTYNDGAWNITTIDGQPLAKDLLPFDQVIDTGQPVYNIEHAITHTNGDRTALRINASPLVDADGQITHVIASISDITKRKQAEATLQESEERYRTVIEAVAEGIVLQHADGSIFTCNASAVEILGLSREQMMGRTSLDERWSAIHEDGSPFPGQDHPSMVSLRTGEPLTNVVMGVRKPNGTLTWISINTRPLFRPQQSSPFAVVASFFDITDRKQAETERAQLIREQAARLEAEAEQFRSTLLVDISTTLASLLNHVDALQQVADRVVPSFADWCVIDLLRPDQSIERVAVAHSNPRQVEVAWQMYQQYPPSLDRPEGVAAILRNGQTRLLPRIPEGLLEAIARTPDHLEMLRALSPKSSILVPLMARGQTLGVISFVIAESDRNYTAADRALAENIAHQVAIATDNIHLYQAEQTARSDAEAANRIKDEFLAVLSHELRSPLNPILGWAQLLQTRPYEATTFARGLETIERNAKLQTQLIEDLLDVSRILRGKLTLTVNPVHLSAVLTAAMETVRLAAEAKGIDLQLWCDPAIDQVLGDAGRLQQVIWNLLSNAVKFTPAGGQVTVRLDRIELGEAPQAQITITDSGKGITPEFLPHIFERFRQADSKTTRQFGGLGLGLAIVRQLVELHGGTVSVYSPGEDQGATFTVRLPLLSSVAPSATALADPTAVDRPALPNLADLRVLVVDDEADARNLLVFVLEQAGAIVTPAASAAAALALLPGLEIDLLISDIGMPGLDGYMLMRQITARFAPQGQPLPFRAIALTAYAGEVNSQQAIAAGFERHFSKPFETEALLTAIAALVKPESLQG